MIENEKLKKLNDRESIKTLFITMQKWENDKCKK